MGVSVLQVQYAQEARSYGLASMLALLAFYGIVRRMTGGWWWLVLAGVAAGAAVWLHNMMWFYLAGLSLAYLIAPGAGPVAEAGAGSGLDERADCCGLHPVDGGFARADALALGELLGVAADTGRSGAGARWHRAG